MSTGIDRHEDVITRGLDFLAAAQRPSGVFQARVGTELTDGASVAEDNPFGTAQIVHSLSRLDSAIAADVVRRALVPLRSGMEPPGVWRHWPREHPRFDELAVDLDDTAWLSTVLRRHGVAVPDNRSLLLAARDRRGLFFTWVIARFPPPLHPGYWRVALRRARH